MNHVVGSFARLETSTAMLDLCVFGYVYVWVSMLDLCVFGYVYVWVSMLALYLCMNVLWVCVRRYMHMYVYAYIYMHACKPWWYT
jgi:hypothetical protein